MEWTTWMLKTLSCPCSLVEVKDFLGSFTRHTLKNCLRILHAVFFNQLHRYGSYMIWYHTSLAIPDYDLLMTLMTKVTTDNSKVDTVKALWWHWWPLVKVLLLPKWWSLNNPDNTKDHWRLPCDYPFDELVTTLKNLMMTSGNIWWPQLVNFITKIKSYLSCWEQLIFLAFNWQLAWAELKIGYAWAKTCVGIHTCHWNQTRPGAWNIVSTINKNWLELK